MQVYIFTFGLCYDLCLSLQTPTKPQQPHTQMPLTSESPDRCEAPPGGEKTRMASSPSTGGVAPPVMPSQAAVEPALKKVRVSTSDGRQVRTDSSVRHVLSDLLPQYS